MMRPHPCTTQVAIATRYSDFTNGVSGYPFIYFSKNDGWMIGFGWAKSFGSVTTIILIRSVGRALTFRRWLAEYASPKYRYLLG